MSDSPALYTREQVASAVNRAVDDVGAELLGQHETSSSIARQSLLDLIVNASLTYLEAPDADLETVAEACYSESLETILGWLEGD